MSVEQEIELILLFLSQPVSRKLLNNNRGDASGRNRQSTLFVSIQFVSSFHRGLFSLKWPNCVASVVCQWKPKKRRN